MGQGNNRTCSGCIESEASDYGDDMVDREEYENLLRKT